VYIYWSSGGLKYMGWLAESVLKVILASLMVIREWMGNQWSSCKMLLDDRWRLLGSTIRARVMHSLHPSDFGRPIVKWVTQCGVGSAMLKVARQVTSRQPVTVTTVIILFYDGLRYLYHMMVYARVSHERSKPTRGIHRVGWPCTPSNRKSIEHYLRIKLLA